MLYLLSMPIVVLLASSNVSNVGSALPSEQDKPGGQAKSSELETMGHALVPYISPTIRGGVLARAASNRIAPSPSDKADKNTSDLRIVYRTWSMFVPSADAARALSQMYQQIYAVALNVSPSIAPSVRIAFEYGALTLTLMAFVRVIPWDVVLDVLQCMMAGCVCFGTCSILVPTLGVVWIVLAAVELTYGVRRGVDALLDGLERRQER